MKRILSISLGSSKRDKKVNITLAGTQFLLERRGTDGNIKLMKHEIEKEDGNVDVITLGGIDIYLQGLKKKYPFKTALYLAKAVRKSILTDGESFRTWVEPEFTRQIYEMNVIKPSDRIFFPTVCDRLEIAKQLLDMGFNKLVFGDLIYNVGFPKVPLYSLKTYDKLATTLGPIITRLPFSWFYPTGEKQECFIKRKPELFENADVIAGDFHLIKKYMIDDLSNKTIISNTITAADRLLLKDRKLKCLITYSPSFDGRTFGSNLVDGIILSILGKKVEQVSKEEYMEVAKTLGYKPNIEVLA